MKGTTMGKPEEKAADEQLQRYFDGELAPEERARVEASLTEDDQLRLASLGEVRDLIRNALHAESADIDVWAALAPEVGAPVGKAEARARRRWGWRAHPASWSAGLMAMAAAALLFAFQPWHPRHPGNDCDVESIETSGAMATVFRIADMPHHGDGTTTVIWTEEED
jgi:anti-sigma factor RsiW